MLGVGIKVRSRPPERRSWIERCSESPFHLDFSGSPSGEVPQTTTTNCTFWNQEGGVVGKGMEGWLKKKTEKAEEKKRRNSWWISLWLILWVWESRAPNTGWPGFSNEFDSSLCLLSLTGDQDCIITSFTHTYSVTHTHRHKQVYGDLIILTCVNYCCKPISGLCAN